MAPLCVWSPHSSTVSSSSNRLAESSTPTGARVTIGTSRDTTTTLVYDMEQWNRSRLRRHEADCRADCRRHGHVHHSRADSRSRVFRADEGTGVEPWHLTIERAPCGKLSRVVQTSNDVFVFVYRHH